MKYNRHNKAFTLAEVILAIGIMGMGMVFAACLFPAAIKEGESASAAMEGLIIAQNGLTTAQQMLTKTKVDSGTKNQVLDSTTQYIWIDGTAGIADLNVSALGLSVYYPSSNDLANPPASFPDTGCIILAQRQGATTSNEYLLISISYRKRKGGSIQVRSIACDQGSQAEQATVLPVSSDPERFQKNGIVIVNANSSNPTSGKMARIVNRSGSNVTIEHPLTTGKVENVIVITEDNSQETPILSATSAIVTLP